MPRIQIFVNPKLYPTSETDQTNQQRRVASFLSNLPAFISQTLDVPQKNVRLFAAPSGEFDQSPVDVDITTSLKIEPESGLAEKNATIISFAQEQLGNGTTVGSHLYLLADDAWATTEG